jgi:hypothetical protein
MDTNTTPARLPKLLPWLAHKAGISEARAEVLWQAAQRHAASRTGESGTPAHAQAAMDRLLILIADESRREDAASFGLRCWARLNASLWQAPIALCDAMALSTTRGWRIIGGLSRPC